MSRLHSLAACALTCAVSLSARAETLYGMSYDGVLYALDTSTGAPTQVRAQLAAAYQSCDSLEYSDGWFYASFQGGRIVRFGFTCGDEVDLGPSGFPWIEAIARRADGTLVVAASQNNDVGAESIGILNPVNGDVTNIVASTNQAILDDMDAIAFSPRGALCAINLVAPSVLATIDPATGAVGPAVSLNGAFAAMTWSATGTLFALDIQVGSCNGMTTLKTINPSNGAAALIGSTEITCMAGLTFGPTPPSVSADLNGDGHVNASDLAILLGAWGPCAAGCCEADLNGDGTVNASDLAILLGAWG